MSPSPDGDVIRLGEDATEHYIRRVVNENSRPPSRLRLRRGEQIDVSSAFQTGSRAQEEHPTTMDAFGAVADAGLYRLEEGRSIINRRPTTSGFEGIPQVDTPLRQSSNIYVGMGALGGTLVILVAGVTLYVDGNSSRNIVIVIFIGSIGTILSVAFVILFWYKRRSNRRLQQEAYRMEPLRWQTHLREIERQLNAFTNPAAHPGAFNSTMRIHHEARSGSNYGTDMQSDSFTNEAIIVTPPLARTRNGRSSPFPFLASHNQRQLAPTSSTVEVEANTITVHPPRLNLNRNRPGWNSPLLASNTNLANLRSTKSLSDILKSRARARIGQLSWHNKQHRSKFLSRLLHRRYESRQGLKPWYRNNHVKLRPVSAADRPLGTLRRIDGRRTLNRAPESALTHHLNLNDSASNFPREFGHHLNYDTATSHNENRQLVTCRHEDEDALFYSPSRTYHCHPATTSRPDAANDDYDVEVEETSAEAPDWAADWAALRADSNLGQETRFHNEVPDERIECWVPEEENHNVHGKAEHSNGDNTHAAALLDPNVVITEDEEELQSLARESRIVGRPSPRSSIYDA